MEDYAVHFSEVFSHLIFKLALFNIDHLIWPIFCCASPKGGCFRQYKLYLYSSCMSAALTASVVVNGEAVHEKSYGLSDVEQQRAATEHTAFCIGSLTKGFTATVIAQLMDAHIIK